MKRNRLLKLGVGILLAGFFLWLVMRQVSVAELKSTLSGASPQWLVAALIAFLAGYAFRIKRWAVMLGHDNPHIGWSRCAGPLMASVAANNILPFRAGDLIRAFGFNTHMQIGAGTAIVTLFAERLLDLLMVLLFLGVGMLTFGADLKHLAGVGGVVPALGAALILAILLKPRMFSLPGHGLARLLAKVAPSIGLRVLNGIDKAVGTLDYFAAGHTMPRLIAWSFLAWLAEGLVFWCAALALPALDTPGAGWLALPIGTLSTLIPSTPGYVGTFDYFTARTMVELGNSAPAATAFALLVHVLLWLPATVLGGIYLILFPPQHRRKPQAC